MTVYPYVPWLAALAYKLRLISHLLSSASLSNFIQAIRQCPQSKAAIILQFHLQSLLLCEQDQVNTPPEGRQERDSKAKPEWDRNALLASAPRGENVVLLQILRQKLPCRVNRVVTSSVFLPPHMVFYQQLSISPASLDVKRKCKALKGVCDRHAIVINVLIQAGSSPPSQLITLQYFGSH